ncbi:MAG: dihydrolipoyl dehydrogenase family protein [Elusimicrobiota bacterium]
MNVVIIGCGPAGEAAAKTLRKLSKSQPDQNFSITIIEKEQAGGLCLNKGCIPSKTLLEQVHGLSKLGLPIHWDNLQQKKNEVVDGIRSQLETSLKTLKINVVYGTARFISPQEIEVENLSGKQTLHFDKAIIATGTESIFPPPLDQFRDELLTSDEMLDVSRTPKSVIIVGGGAIGCEFACLLHAAGSDVTIIELKNQLLPGEDLAIAQALQKNYETRGIKVITETKVSAVQKLDKGWQVTLLNGLQLEAREILVSVGRSPNHTALQLELAHIEMNGKIPKLNEYLQTSHPHIYVAGDAGTTRLAHAAAAQGEAIAAHILGGKEKYDDRFVPRCLYSWPEVASVGSWKYECEEKNEPVKTTRAFFKGSAKALASGDSEGFVQIVLNPDTGKILGAQIIGPHATELIHIFSVALKTEMNITQLSSVMFAHPTLSEVLKDAAKK